jgi:hypothetical protein
MEDLNIALLIDSDNVSPRYISGILSELSKYGKITIRRMYGDWSQDRLHTWMKCSSRFSLTPVMQPNNTPGKNASDIGLIIDAMDILYTGDVQGFCLVSSDGDFNKLATRLREAGKFVIGMGEKKTPESFRASCERFIFLDVIESEDPTARRRPDPYASAGSQSYGSASQSYGSSSQAYGSDSSADSSSGRSASGAGTASRRRKTAVSEPALPYKASSGAAQSSQASGSSAGSQSTYYPARLQEDPDLDQDYDSDSEASFTDKETIEAAIISIITDNSAEGKETGLGEIGSRLVKIFPDFDVRNYHYSKLSEYLKDFPSLKVENRDNAVWVSLNSSTDSEIEQQILRIFKKHGTDDMYLATLKKELLELNPNLEASIRRSGVTRFSVYLHRMIGSVEVNGRHVTLKRQ